MKKSDLFCAFFSVSEEETSSKTKRDISGLYPFPRVGRPDPLWSSRFFGKVLNFVRKGKKLNPIFFKQNLKK